IKYESFVRFAETSNMYILITKSGQQNFIFKNSLNDEEINSFKEFIKEKCKNIKW
ncbi:YcxB family protein, partial [Clostridium saudiense]|nr:YcxB family protein [Clostridium saudiense]